MAQYLIIRSEESSRIYSREVAARLARVSLDMIELCEREELVKARRMSSGGFGFTPEEIGELARIRRLQEDLELDLPAVEIILRMRQRMIQLLQEINAVEQRMAQREQELSRQIQRLRRQLAEGGKWE